MSVINTQLTSSDAAYALMVTPENIVADGSGTAVFSYSDLNRSIQDLVLIEGNAEGTVASYNALDVYHGTIDNIQATGAQPIDTDVFTILGYEVVATSATAIVKLTTELGWEYSGNPSFYPLTYVPEDLFSDPQISASLVDATYLSALENTSYTDDPAIDALPSIDDDVTEAMYQHFVQATPIGLESGKIILSFDPTQLEFSGTNSVLEGSGFAIEGPSGTVEAALVSVPGIGATDLDGALIASLAFLKNTSEPSYLHVSVLDAGNTSGYDYPIGFTIEV